MCIEGDDSTVQYSRRYNIYETFKLLYILLFYFRRKNGLMEGRGVNELIVKLIVSEVIE